MLCFFPVHCTAVHSQVANMSGKHVALTEAPDGPASTAAPNTSDTNRLTHPTANSSSTSAQCVGQPSPPAQGNGTTGPNPLEQAAQTLLARRKLQLQQEELQRLATEQIGLIKCAKAACGTLQVVCAVIIMLLMGSQVTVEYHTIGEDAMHARFNLTLVCPGRAIGSSKVAYLGGPL